MSIIWETISFIVQLAVMFMFCLTAGFVLAFGKPKTGIYLDFFFLFAHVLGSTSNTLSVQARG